MTSYNVQGKVVSITNGQPVPYATVQLFQVTKGTYATSLISPTVPPKVTTAVDGTFSVTFAYTPPVNLILRVSQTVGGVTTYIYSENPATDTRWVIGDVLYVILKANALVTINPPPTPMPTGDEFIFTRVGNIVTEYISQKNGYAYANEPPEPMGGWPWPTEYSDQPFGSTLWIGGWFGAGLTTLPLGAQYYKVQWAPGVQKTTGPGPWTDVMDALSNSWFDFSTENWVNQSMGPSTVGGVPNLYQLPNDPTSIPWAFPDLIAQLDTTKLPTGPVTLRVVGYTSAAIPIIVGGILATWFSLYVDPVYGQLPLQIDNTPPTSVAITGVNIYPAPANPTPPPTTIPPSFTGNVLPCATALLGTSATDCLEVVFEASDALGHLLVYSISAIWGADNSVPAPGVATPPPSALAGTVLVAANDNYGNHINGTNQWSGSASTAPPPPLPAPQLFATRYYGGGSQGYDSAEMGSCAYDLRLVVDKRTTNGYGLIYVGYEYDFTLIVTRS